MHQEQTDNFILIINVIAQMRVGYEMVDSHWATY